MTDDTPPITLTRDQARRVDQYAIQTLGIPGMVLMENAGLNAASAAFDLLREQGEIVGTQPAVAIVCGGGNNGGDGYVIARHLDAWGLTPRLYSTADPDKLTGDAKANHDICDRLGLIATMLAPENGPAFQQVVAEWESCHLLIDAILGTGFQGDVREPAASVIRAINTLQNPTVFCIDVPSGLDCDTGHPAPGDTTVRADLTMTFVAPKQGFDNPDAQPYLGHTVIGDIGIPPRAVGQALE